MGRQNCRSGRQTSWGGLTIVEILIVITVIAILATLGVVTYQGMQRRASASVVLNDLSGAHSAVTIDSLRDGGMVAGDIPASFVGHKDVTTEYFARGGERYSGLSPVQNGVLFYNVCEELKEDPRYSVIHARDGNSSQSVIMKCDDNIAHGNILITGWESKTWAAPVTKETLETYIASVPYDSWWTNRQSVVRGFYEELIGRFERRGGTWPITSFWDPWANEWSGVKKEDLPAPTSTDAGAYCLMATHRHYSDITYVITSENSTPREGSCQ